MSGVINDKNYVFTNMGRYNKYQTKQLHTYIKTHTHTHTIDGDSYLAGWPSTKTIRASVSTMLTLWRVIYATTLYYIDLLKRWKKPQKSC